MPDARGRRTGDPSAQVIKLAADAAAMREHIDELEGRVLRLESELAVMRASVTKLTAPVALSSAPRPTSRRPTPIVPPPLPAITASRPSAPPRKAGGRRSFVDISEAAELLLESIPPPPRPPRK